jgi:hypothetical protein
MEIASGEDESENEAQEIALGRLHRLGEKREEEPEPLPDDASGIPPENDNEEEPENQEDQIQEQDPEDIMRRITGRIRQELQELMINCNRTVQRLIEENWPNGPIREERLSAVLHGVVVQASSLMAKASPDTPFAAKRDLMRKLRRIKNLVGKFLVLLRWPRKY